MEQQIEDAVKYIFSEIEKGRALRNVLKDEGTPSTSTFSIWMDRDEELSKRYARACEKRADVIFDDILDIADDSSGDKMINEDGREVLNSEFVQRSRLRIDARKWILAKMNPKKYGDRTTNIIEGGEKPIQISFED